MSASFAKTVRKVTYTPNDSCDLVMGEVTSSSPLKIRYGTTELSGTFLRLSPFCVKTSVDLSHRHTCPDGSTSVELELVELWRGLRKGDKVLMLKCNAGQMFYVLQREEGVMIE